MNYDSIEDLKKKIEENKKKLELKETLDKQAELLKKDNKENIDTENFIAKEIAAREMVNINNKFFGVGIGSIIGFFAIAMAYLPRDTEYSRI